MSVKIQMLIAADYASIDVATGKLNILGAFTRIYAREFPVVHHRMAIVVRVTVDDPTETAEPQNFELTLVNADGAELVQVSDVVAIPRDSRGNRQDANIILELNDIEFSTPGDYEVTFDINGTNIGSTTIELMQI